MMKLTRFKLALLAYVLFDFLIGGHCGGFLPLGQMAAAQSGPPAIGNITSSGSTCSTTSVPTNCVILQLDAATGAATIEITGTFVGTGQFEAFSGSAWTNINCTPPNSTTAASSATAAGAWQCNVAGYSAIRVRASAYVSGTLVVIINSAHASAKSGGGSPFSSGGLTANLIPKENGAGFLVDSLLSDSGSALTYNAKAVPNYASGGTTAGQVAVSNGSSNLVDSSLNDGRNGVVTIPGQVSDQGTLTVSQLAAPANATLVVTGGVGTNYTYKLVAKAGSVGTAANSGVSTAAGPTTLDGTHFIDINFVSQNGCTSIDVYRTVGGAAQGKIGNVLCTTTGAALTLRDNALVGDASSAPAADTGTGGLTVAGPVSIGVSPAQGTVAGGTQINLPNNLFITWRNAANNADILGIRVDGNNTTAVNNFKASNNAFFVTKITTYNNIATAGMGLATVYGATAQKAETTTADTNVLTYTPPATAGTYRVSVAISVSSATSGIISYTLSYKDSNGNAVTNVAGPLFQHGTAAPNTTFTTSAAGNYSGSTLIDVDTSATAIVVKWVGGGTTAAKMSAAIEQVQ